MSTSSKISIRFERREFFHDKTPLTILHAEEFIKLRESQHRISLKDAVNALRELSDELTNPSYSAHPNDLFTFSYNGKSFSLTWEPACYTTDIGVV